MDIASSCGTCLPVMNSTRVLRRPGIRRPDSESRSSGVIHRSTHLHVDLAAARQRAYGASDEVEQKLDLVFGHVPGIGAPDELVLGLANEATREICSAVFRSMDGAS